MIDKRNILLVVLLSPLLTITNTNADNTLILEQITVTATKREKLLQDISGAISVLSGAQIETGRIDNLLALEDGSIPSLRIQAFGATPSASVIAIRGNGPTDPGQTTRDGSVALYKNGFYLSRSHGSTALFSNLDRIEILRGPQGTLFGRNTTGGAINMVSKRPTGELGFNQSVDVGKYDEKRSNTHVELPEMGNFLANLDVMYAKRKGWVKNTAADASDYNEMEKSGVSTQVNWQMTDILSATYFYDYGRDKGTPIYYQLAVDPFGAVGVEEERQTTTRYPISPLKPTLTEQHGHGLLVSVDINNLVIESRTGYRTLKESTVANYGGTLYSNGFVDFTDIDVETLTQELQVLGNTDTVEWVAGAYYFNEEVRDIDQVAFTRLSFLLDVNANVIGIPNTPIPLTTFGVSPRDVVAETDSYAAYGHVTWTPAFSHNRLHITAGIRHTQDDKTGHRVQGATVNHFDFSTDHTDPMVSIGFDLSADLRSYVRWAKASQAGGVNLRSLSFSGYGNEKAEMIELGVKYQNSDNRIRANVALFSTDYDDKLVDIIDPTNIAINETINAKEGAEIKGLELDFTMIPIEHLSIGLSYTYLDEDMPLQPNPLAGNTLEKFDITQAPKHAGSVTLDYDILALDVGTVTAHLGVTSTSQYAYVSIPFERRDAYTLVNASLTLANITFAANSKFSASIWGENLTDEIWVNASFAQPNGVVTQSFAEGRTAGVSLSYAY